MSALALWALLLCAPRARAQQGGAGLRRLDAERNAAEQAITEEFDQRRKAMTESEAWTLSTDEERRQRLEALKEEFRDHERRLKEEYEARRDMLTKGGP